MKKFISLTFLFLSISGLSQKDYLSILDSNISFRREMNRDYSDSLKSPLTKEDLKIFIELPFFEIDTGFYIIARFEKSKSTKPFEMKTSTSRKPIYKEYGIIYFEINKKKFSLKIYQNQKLKEIEKYKDYLFLPFTDNSNGTETYGGGRYLDLKIPQDSTIVLDFNKAYNPYCAYNHGYSCPVPPKENYLDIKIEAGVRFNSEE